MNIYIQVFLGNLCFHLSWAVPRNGIAESFYKKLLNYFPKWLYYFTFIAAVYESFNCFTSSLELGIVSLILTILVVVWWHPVVALTYISLITTNVEHHFMFWFPLVTGLFKFLLPPPFIFTDYFSHYWVARILYMFLDISPLWGRSCKYYLPVCGFKKKCFLKSVFQRIEIYIFIKIDVLVLSFI